MMPDPESTMQPDTESLARGVVRSLTDDLLVLAPGGTDYQIHLTPDADTRAKARVGGRISGYICADALRVHPNDAGGQFIEPLWGRPRIVCGTVQRIDHEHATMLIRAVVPIRLEHMDNTDLSQFQVGGMVNCYVESDVYFHAIDG